ncbi:MAG: hypothetical protein M0R39_16800 [Prolixibacteraceae bacterium]|nr:hypothetical protein [Prolixibacteraceae bacterium]
MKLKFEYSFETELESFEYLASSYETFKRYGYRVSVPSGFDLNTKDKKGLKKQIELELESTMVKKAKKEIINRWGQNKDVINAFFDQLPYEKPNTMIVKLTKYGTGSFYNYGNPKYIVVMVNTVRDLLMTVIHESIHCVIEKPVVQKHKLDQPTKEGLLDWLFINNIHIKSLFPDYQYRDFIKKPTNKLIEEIGWDIFCQ